MSKTKNGKVFENILLHLGLYAMWIYLLNVDLFIGNFAEFGLRLPIDFFNCFWYHYENSEIKICIVFITRNFTFLSQVGN